MSTTQVIVVGGGPAGLTLACSLALAGVEVRVFEQTLDYPSSVRGSRGTAYQARTLEVFDDLGVIDAALDGTWTDNPFRIYRDGRLATDLSRTSAAIPRSHQVPYPVMARPLQTWRVEEILVERLGDLGVKVECGRQVVGFEQDDDGVTVAVEHTETARGAWGHAWTSPTEGVGPSIASTNEVEHVRATYLVGCDGARGVVRGLAGLEYEFGNDLGFAGMVADVRVSGIEPTFARYWYDAMGDAVILSPQPTTQNFQFIAQLKPDEQGAYPEPSLELAQALFDERAAIPGVELHDMTWKTFFRVREALVDRYRNGRVFIGGDAAHIHSPSGGQGANTGIQDGYNLGWKLAHVIRGLAPASVLDSYESERRATAAAVLEFTGANHEAMHARTFTGRVQQRLRRFRQRSFDRQQNEKMNQLGVAYPTSPLNIGAAHTEGPTIGHRAPDGKVIDASDGTRLRLFDLFRGWRHTVLLFGVDEGLLTLGSALQQRYGDAIRVCVLKDVDDRALGWSGPTYVDWHEESRAAYHADARPLVVVRPDGYLAFHGTAAEESTLVAGMDRMLLPTGAA